MLTISLNFSSKQIENLKKLATDLNTYLTNLKPHVSTSTRTDCSLDYATCFNTAENPSEKAFNLLTAFVNRLLAEDRQIQLNTFFQRARGSTRSELFTQNYCSLLVLSQLAQYCKELQNAAPYFKDKNLINFLFTLGKEPSSQILIKKISKIVKTKITEAMLALKDDHDIHYNQLSHGLLPDKDKLNQLGK